MTTTKRTVQHYSIWNSPPNSRFELLAALEQRGPTSTGERLAKLREQPRADVQHRKRAYRTQVTHETLRRTLP